MKATHVPLCAALVGWIAIGCQFEKKVGDGPHETIATSKALRSKSAPVSAPPTSAALPRSDRVFYVEPEGNGEVPGLLLGTDANAMWAADVEGVGRAQVRWRKTGDGVVQRVAVGNLGEGRRLFIARGVGRGYLQAPLVVESINLRTGEARELWRYNGERNEAAHLSVSDIDGDGRAELAFAYYNSKYFVRTRHIHADGRVTEGRPVRMATSRVYGDVDGDGRSDEIVARVYGDARSVPGDLRIARSDGWQVVPTENGVRGLILSRIGTEKRPSIYFADGWVSNYGKEAKAQLKRARWNGAGYDVAEIGRSPDEFTFFELEARDVDGDGTLEIVARGDKKVTVFDANPDGAFSSRVVATIEPVLNTAIGSAADGRWYVFVPADTETRMVALP